MKPPLPVEVVAIIAIVIACGTVWVAAAPIRASHSAHLEMQKP